MFWNYFSRSKSWGSRDGSEWIAHAGSESTRLSNSVRVRRRYEVDPGDCWLSYKCAHIFRETRSRKNEGETGRNLSDSKPMMQTSGRKRLSDKSSEVDVDHHVAKFARAARLCKFNWSGQIGCRRRRSALVRVNFQVRVSPRQTLQTTITVIWSGDECL